MAVYSERATITLGGVTLATPYWRWAFVTGPSSPEIRFYVDNVVHEQLSAVSNPVTLAARVPQGDGSDPVVIDIQKLHIVGVLRIDPWTVRYTLADARWLYKDILCGGTFNVTRRANDLNEFAQPDLEGLLQQTSQQRLFRYLPGTLREPGVSPPKHAKPTADVTAGVGEMWTALQCLEYVLANAHRTGLPHIEYVIEAADNGHVEEDVNHGPLGETFPAAVAGYLSRARVGLYVRADGKWVIYDLAASPIPAARVGGIADGGVLVRENMDRARPVAVTVRSAAEFEVLFEFDEDDTVARNLDEDDLLRTVRNVGILPQTIEVGGKRYERGTWLDVRDLVTLYNQVGWPSGRTVTFDDLRRWKLAKSAPFTVFCRDGNPTMDAAAAARLAALLGAYRTYYQIPQAMMDAVTDWAPVRSVVGDPITGKRAASPVWMDYAIAPSGREPIRKGLPKSMNESVNVSHPGVLTTDNAAPARLAVVDDDLGVFAVAFADEDLTGRVLRVFPGRLANPIAANNVNVAANQLENNALAAGHRMSCILTLQFRTIGSASIFALRLQGATFLGGAGLGPPYEVRQQREPARFQWPLGAADAQPARCAYDANGNVRVEGGVFANRAAVRAIALQEARRVYFSFADRWVGDFEHNGYDAATDRPNGNVSSVSVEFTNGVVTTRYSLPEGTPPPNLYDMLPTDVRRIVYRQIEEIKR